MTIISRIRLAIARWRLRRVDAMLTSAYYANRSESVLFYLEGRREELAALVSPRRRLSREAEALRESLHRAKSRMAPFAVTDALERKLIAVNDRIAEATAACSK